MAAFLPRPDPTRTFVRIFDKESDKESPHKKGMRFLAEPVRIHPGVPASTCHQSGGAGVLFLNVNLVNSDVICIRF